MSLTISGSLSTTLYSKEPTAEAARSTTSASSASSAIVPKSQYLGGYISSASAALSLLTQTGSALSERSETRSDGPGGKSDTTSGADFFEAAAGLGNNVFAQVFKSSSNVQTIAGQTVTTGEYDAAVASATSDGKTAPTDGDAQTVTASITSGYDTLSTNFDPTKGLNIHVSVNGDPKKYDNIFIDPVANASDPTTRPIVQDALTQFLESTGLSDTAAKAQSKQISDFIFKAADDSVPAPSNKPAPKTS